MLHEFNCKKKKMSNGTVIPKKTTLQQPILQEYDPETDERYENKYCLSILLESQSYELLTEVLSKLSENRNVMRVIDKTIILPKGKFVKEQMDNEIDKKELKDKIKELELKLDYYDKMRNTGMFGY